MVCKCDDGVLVFDEQTGRTHLLDFAAWKVLKALFCGDGVAVTETELWIDPGALETSELECELLRALEAAGLIERCSA